MKKRCLFVPFALGLVTAVVVLGILNTGQSKVTAAPTAGTRYVATTGDDFGNDCSSQNAPCRTIQHAVDEADHGDTVKVAAGTYTDVHVRPRNDFTTTGVVAQVVYISKSITLRGGYRATDWTTPDPVANPTTLDAEGQGRVLYIVGDTDSTVENLRITGGDSAGLEGWITGADAGGGIYCYATSVTISDCDIFGNLSYWGGGAFFFATAATLESNKVTSNTGGWGGGFFLMSSHSTLRDNTFTHNCAHNEGGGAYLAWTSGALDSNVLSFNEARFAGGGLSLDYFSAATLTDNLVLNNEAETGGGVFIWADATLVNTMVIGNQASRQDGGISIWWSSPRLLHTTLASNSGPSGVSVHAGSGTTAPAFTNTIFVSHTVGISASANSTVTLNSTLWGIGRWANDTDWAGEGSVLASGNRWGEPAFSDPVVGDYHIGPGSAALDEGVRTVVATDIDGEPRLGPPDLGADEYWAPGALKRVYLPVTLRRH